ncbi:hypothetical protein AGOR_G00130290 [Albula goreensis]|uniref:C3/C5 convertase n=1 Tax=Albula goreensis TaxID=1534307 RepID=A0A8T3DGI4_9TELE|nr:hypothetical protein AGOR_G00130290 [Albula goreensis]
MVRAARLRLREMSVQVCAATAVCTVLLITISAGAVQAQAAAEEYGDYDYGGISTNCSESVSIAGGWVSYSQGGFPGSVLTYHCKEGHYTFPVNSRVCSDEGEWSTMRMANGRTVSQATCKEVQCPAQLQLDNGELWPKQLWFSPGQEQQFSCLDGFMLYGSAVRNCTLSGEWTGTIPVCDDRGDDCMDPGVPPGALRDGDRFRVGEKVKYRCQAGLDLLGSAERVCLESREWSGSEPRCLAPYIFDSPESVAQAMAGSLSGVMDVTSPEFKKRVSFGRSIRPEEGRLNVYILLDTSGSITKEHFQKARDATARLIRKLDSYEVNMKFQVISYATEPREIMSITSPWSSSVAHVLQELSDFQYTAHGKKTGTNLHAALNMVYRRMAFLKENRDSKFNETQHVILIITDGHSNTGMSPKSVLGKIRAELGYSSTKHQDLQPGGRNMEDHRAENFLDIYVFGVGNSVNKKELNSIASQKQGEHHIFILKEYEDLGTVFDSMISDSAVTMCGIAQETASTKHDFTRPWHVELETLSSSKAENCKGSIITENWILTAAHCLKPEAQQNPQSVMIKHGKTGRKTAASVIVHPLYNINGLKHKNVDEFYDYDIALVKLNQSIKLSGESRPICVPCTKPANGALKLDPNSTCQQHEKALFPLEETQAFFITKGVARKQTHIQTGSRREQCIKQAAMTFKPGTTASLTEFVTDRFLCTGGSQLYKDELTCKGDSGGSLFLRKKLRYFQVAVVSWGNIDVCSSASAPPADARDFHISIFSVLPWLEQHLGQELQFLPFPS